MGAAGSGAGTGNMNAPVSVWAVATAKGNASVNDEELIREAQSALKLLVDEFATSTTGRCMNCGFMVCDKECAFRPARATITKLEARLLNE